jgi:hypothetical protein
MEGFEALKQVFNSKELMDQLESPEKPTTLYAVYKKITREYKLAYSRHYYQTHKEQWRTYFNRVNQEEQRKYQAKYRRHNRPINYKYVKFLFPENTP